MAGTLLKLVCCLQSALSYSVFPIISATYIQHPRLWPLSHSPSSLSMTTKLISSLEIINHMQFLSTLGIVSFSAFVYAIPPFSMCSPNLTFKSQIQHCLWKPFANSAGTFGHAFPMSPYYHLRTYIVAIKTLHCHHLYFYQIQSP